MVWSKLGSVDVSSDGENSRVNIIQKVILLGLSLLTSLVSAEDWYPSQFGADDTLGAINHLTARHVVEAAKLVKSGKTYALGVETGRDSPAYPPRTYSMTVLQLSDGTGTPWGTNKATGNDDLMTTWMGIGSQIDGLGHVGIDHVYYNGNKAQDFVKNTGLTKLSTDKIPPIVARGVLLDMARHLGKPMLGPGTVFNRAEIDAAAKAQGVAIQKGDVVLFHTGWLNMAEKDGKAFMQGEPGMGIEGAAYLAKLGAVAVGSDTWGVEVMPFENKGEFFPVHQELLAKNGVYILENMDTRALAKDEAWEFLFVLGQPRFVGSVQAVINPVAIR